MNPSQQGFTTIGLPGNYVTVCAGSVVPSYTNKTVLVTGKKTLPHTGKINQSIVL